MSDTVMFLLGAVPPLLIGILFILANRFMDRDLYRCWWNLFDWRGRYESPKR